MIESRSVRARANYRVDGSVDLQGDGFFVIIAKALYEHMGSPAWLEVSIGTASDGAGDIDDDVEPI